jgi:predicted enzyme related to lactoylglutathione lyase
LQKTLNSKKKLLETMMSRLCHFEIHACEPQRLTAFYQSLFGWKIQQWGTNEYWVIKTGVIETGVIETDPGGQPGAVNGGILRRRGPAAAAGAPVNCFVCKLEVASTDDALAKAVSLGGSMAVPKAPVPGIGWLAYAKDPDGNIFGLLQPDKSAA